MDDDEVDSDSELDSTWEQLLQTNPQRLVDIFDLNYDSIGQKNKWGDTVDVSARPFYNISYTYIGLMRSTIGYRTSQALYSVRRQDS